MGFLSDIGLFSFALVKSLGSPKIVETRYPSKMMTIWADCQSYWITIIGLSLFRVGPGHQSAHQVRGDPGEVDRAAENVIEDPGVVVSVEFRASPDLYMNSESRSQFLPTHDPHRPSFSLRARDGAMSKRLLCPDAFLAFGVRDYHRWSRFLK